MVSHEIEAAELIQILFEFTDLDRPGRRDHIGPAGILIGLFVLKKKLPEGV